MANQGNKGKFSERIKKIAFRKRNRMVYEEDENNKIRYQNVLKVLAAVPGMVYSNVQFDDSKVEDKSTKKSNKVSRSYLISDIDVNKIRAKQESHFKSSEPLKKTTVSKSLDNKHDNENKQLSDFKKVEIALPNAVLDDKGKRNDIETVKGDDILDEEISLENGNEKVEKLEKDILDIIKKKLVLSINNLEIMQSELYILSEVNGDAKTQEECERQIKEIKDLLDRIEKLKEQYDYLKDNYDFEYLMALDDDNLIDKIIELKDVFNNNEVRAFVEDYKLLDEYKYLYLKIDEIQEKTDELDEKKEEELEKLKKRDIDFEKLKNKVYNIDNDNNLYRNMLKNQDEIIKELDKTISKIDSYEQVNYHIKGLNKLLFNSFKYFGLLMMNPLKGIFPSIAFQTLVARDMVRGAYHGIQWEEERKKVYEAVDYSSSISSVIDNMDQVNNNIDSTLSDLIKLKDIYKKRFKKYQDDNSEYKEIIDKINDMENKMLGNKIKVEMLKKKALNQKKTNEKKLTLVNKLNDNQNI